MQSFSMRLRFFFLCLFRHRLSAVLSHQYEMPGMSALTEFLQVFFQLFRIIKKLTRITKKTSAGRREVENAVASFKKRDAKLIFEGGYSP